MYLVIGEVPVERDAHGLRLPGDEDEAGVLRDGHFLADLLRPLPGVLLRMRVDPRLGVQREVNLANSAMALENSNPSQGIEPTRSVLGSPYLEVFVEVVDDVDVMAVVDVGDDED